MLLSGPAMGLPLMAVPERDVVASAVWSASVSGEAVGMTPLIAGIEAGDMRLAFAADIALRSI